MLCYWQVKALKEKIEVEKGKVGYPAAGQKLIYAGKRGIFSLTALLE